MLCGSHGFLVLGHTVNWRDIYGAPRMFSFSAVVLISVVT